jgi:hypothetical protein
MTEKDYKDQMVEYIIKNLSKGYSTESLKWALINQGYSRSEILKAMDNANQELAKKVPPLKEKPVIRRELLDEEENLILREVEQKMHTPINEKKGFFKRIFWG